MMRERTVKFAVNSGRSALEIWASDWEHAAHELAIEGEMESRPHSTYAENSASQTATLSL